METINHSSVSHICNTHQDPLVFSQDMIGSLGKHERSLLVWIDSYLLVWPPSVPLSSFCCLNSPWIVCVRLSVVSLHVSKLLNFLVLILTCNEFQQYFTCICIEESVLLHLYSCTASEDDEIFVIFILFLPTFFCTCIMYDVKRVRAEGYYARIQYVSAVFRPVAVHLR